MTRANTTLDESGENMRIAGASKSADARKRDMDEWRLKILLEELYKDKKYFDHVIDSTGIASITFQEIKDIFKKDVLKNLLITMLLIFPHRKRQRSGIGRTRSCRTWARISPGQS